MITITPDNQIDRDGEVIGSIIGTIAWMKAAPASRIKGQIKQACGISELTFEVIEPPTVEESSTVQTPSAVQVVDTMGDVKPAPASDDAGVGNLSAIPEPPRSAVLGDRDPEWQRWFVATRGEAAFKAKWPTRQLP